MKAPLSPVMVGGIALTLAIVNLLTIRIPPGASPLGYAVGYVGFPVFVAIVYTIWYVRRRPGG